MRLYFPPRVCRALLCGLYVIQAILSGPQRAWAVVGQAERFDEIRDQDVKDFHENLMAEEKEKQLRMLQDMQGNVPSENMESYTKDLEDLKTQLLRMPKRDRLKFGLDGQYTYDSNIQRRPARQQESDSVFDTIGFAEVDLGGKKTDLRSEARVGKQWNMNFPISDFLQVEERIRYRRKYFKKITHSVNSRLARHSSKTIEIDGKKVRWDSNQDTAFNYVVSRKLSVNTEFNATKRLFTSEASDQDSQWDVLMSPSAFWNFTPKSRVALGYSFGASRIRSKTGDSNSHEVHMGYFGRVTRKSSISFDFAFSHQTPRSLDTAAINTIKLGTGYILQLTPKSQLTFQAIRSIQNSTSNSPNEESVTATKSDEHFTHDNISISLNTRLNRKLTAIADVGFSHFRNKVSKTGDEDNETRQLSFPISLTFNYMIAKWIQYRLRYTFAFRTGDETADTYVAHTLMTGVNMTF
ncbi:MAG TPA: hypothetical protein VL688_02450 [Verrucomicrobiae bacterium]|jgi:hypothetical protein|nr:hypothetical protein [Verrucomicrobiae bacterium]